MTDLATRQPSGTSRGRVHTIHYNLSFIQQGAIDVTKPVIVLLHDFPGDASSWSPILPSLTAHPVVAIDLLGNGESDKPWPADTSIWGHADAVNLALRKLGLEQVILVGVGLGGGVAEVLATRLMPDLVLGLVLIASAAYATSYSPNWPLPEMEKRRDPEAPMHTPSDALEADLRKTLPLGSSNPSSLSGAALDALVKPYLNHLGKEILFQQIRLLEPYYLNAVGADLAHLEIPTLIIWGDRDTIFEPKLGQRLQRAIPGSRLEIVKGAGHLILNDAPDAVARLLGDFTSKSQR